MDESTMSDATLSSINNESINDESINDESINDGSINDKSINDESINDESILSSINDESINESFIINETAYSNVIENSIDATMPDNVQSFNNDSDEISNAGKNLSLITPESGYKSNDNLRKSLVTSPICGNTSDHGEASTSSKAQSDLSKSLVTSDIDISDDESDHNKPFPSSDVHNISDTESEDLHTDVKGKRSPNVYIIESSDENSDNETTRPSNQIKTEVKMERGIKFEPDVKWESHDELKTLPSVKFEAGVKLESSASKLNPLQLVDDVKPIHLGKTGMETFNNQQSMALNCMKTLCKSLEVKPAENEMADNPEQLKIELMPHQRSALTWMLWREEQRPKGGILADDMGLGKTMSMISLVVTKLFMEQPESQSSDSSDEDEDAEAKTSQPSWIAKGSSRKSLVYGGTLVVCPASIMEQWKSEVKNRVRSKCVEVLLHHGSNRETRPRNLSKPDMVITTYGIVSSECEKDGALFSIKWERIILDEAHIIRNHTSKQSVACCKLKASSRWALTGTPIQNKEADLYPLLKFLRCRPFDDYSSFKMWISKSSSKSQERLTQVLQALLLRRTKEDLKEIGQIESLPEKRKEIVAVKLTTDEMNVYQKVLLYSQSLFSQYLHQRQSRNNFSIQANSDNKNEWVQLHQQISKTHGNSDAISGHHILILILRLRQICIHPSLINAMLSDGELDGDSDTENAPEVDLLEQLSKLQIGSQVEDDETVSKASSKLLMRSNAVFDDRRVSSKFQKIIEFITEKLIGSGDKGIVVSQFASVLNMFGEHLKDLGIRFVKLTGETKIDTRNDIVTRFNNSSSSVQVMLLSLTAGGVGLNLVGANHLFFVDPHWNPQLENQAQDRIYRIGQKKPVTIYKFLCDDTIERRIQHLQEQKLEIANQVLTGAKRTSNKLTMDDMKTLFEL